MKFLGCDDVGSVSLVLTLSAISQITHMRHSSEFGSRSDCMDGETPVSAIT